MINNTNAKGTVPTSIPLTTQHKITLTSEKAVPTYFHIENQEKIQTVFLPSLDHFFLWESENKKITTNARRLEV